MQVLLGSKARVLLVLMPVLVCALSAGKGGAVERIALGGEAGLAWQEGGGGIDPVIILGARDVSNENTPGGVIDFASRQGWIFPESADPSENIALQSLNRGGAVTAPTVLEDLKAELVKMLDNDANTAFERKSVAGRRVNSLGVVLEFDLGARFGVSRLRFFPRNAAPDFPAPDFPFQDDFLRAFEIFLNDGTRETLAAGLPVFTSILLTTQNDRPVVDVEIKPQYVRYIRVKSQTTVGFEVAEFQVFGQGFVPTAEFHSDIFDLGENLALWGNLRWQEESIGDPIRSQVAISTRSGFDDSPVVFNRLRTNLDGAEVPWKTADKFSDNTRGRELVSQLDAPGLDVKQARALYGELSLSDRNLISLTQTDYRNLRSAEKGSVKDDLDNWSTWSPPYSAAGQVSAAALAAGEGGVRIVSPGPRRYFQFKAEYSSEDLFSAKGIGALSFEISRPALAEEIAAEISPRQADLGQDTPFSLVLVPHLRPGVNSGFSSIEISTPVRVTKVNKIEISRPDGSSQSQDFGDADLSELPVVRGAFSIDRVEDDYFQISFPRMENSLIEPGQMTVLGVDFQCVVLRTGTAFSVQALSGTPGDIPQRVVGGNIFALRRSGDVSLIRDPGSLVVLVEEKGGLLINVGATPSAFTPNGDRINDVAQIRFDITDLTSGADVHLRIYDLSGRMVRQVDAGSYGSGRYARTWDGKDAGGQTVPPGLYVYKIDVDADSGNAETSGVIAVVY